MIHLSKLFRVIDEEIVKDAVEMYEDIIEMDIPSQYSNSVSLKQYFDTKVQSKLGSLEDYNEQEKEDLIQCLSSLETAFSGTTLILVQAMAS